MRKECIIVFPCIIIVIVAVGLFLLWAQSRWSFCESLEGGYWL